MIDKEVEFIFFVFSLIILQSIFFFFSFFLAAVGVTCADAYSGGLCMRLAWLSLKHGIQLYSVYTGIDNDIYLIFTLYGVQR